MSDFDRVLERRNTDSLKYDFAAARGMPEGLIPLWVADMDFSAPEPVREALSRAVSHGIFGYTMPRADYYDTVTEWFARRYGYAFRREHIVTTPGIVFALAMAVRAFTGEGDGVLIQRPVYYPFTEVISDNKRRIINSPLILNAAGRYETDFDDFERQIVENDVRLFLLCSPHNPIGRVWSAAELERVGDICARHGCVVVSDEIHCDFTYPGAKHTMFPSIKEGFAKNCVLCTAPSKSFNLAGLQISNIVISNSTLRRAFKAEIAKTGYSQPSLPGVVACKAAYGSGGAWLDELKSYIHGNLNLLRDFLRERIPQIKLIEPEGTYLIWLDMREIVKNAADARRLIVEKAGLWLDDGTMFGSEGEGFQRINIACPRSVLREALENLAAAVNCFIK
ncbi:MAG: pyridoxal phosphate-dependent aminotransferase [Clostridiales Family XIII bacterium]|jgi:cystathionine beta-lyase|nr:pyridoxal phosphate-dependent aminotransferase [Clostridiales Family XIII bacterium]